MENLESAQKNPSERNRDWIVKREEGEIMKLLQ